VSSFVISVDSTGDRFAPDLDNQSVHHVTMKRIQNGVEVAEHFENANQANAFYESIKKGLLPTTVAINEFEHGEHFKRILKSTKGDIIHLTLSSGLSLTYDNAAKAAEEINVGLKSRRIYVVDTLVATIGIDCMIDELVRLRDKNVPVIEAIDRIKNLRDHLQGWVISGDLFHLRRGGRISGVKATIGTILNVKPIITINRNGKLAIESKQRGASNAISYIIDKMNELGERANPNFLNQAIYLTRTGESQLYSDFKSAIQKKYPNIEIKESHVCPIIGTHLGAGSVIALWEGAERLEI